MDIGLINHRRARAGLAVPGKATVYDESQVIDLNTEPLQGGILVKVLILSIDPYLRQKMQPENPLHAFVSPFRADLNFQSCVSQSSQSRCS